MVSNRDQRGTEVRQWSLVDHEKDCGFYCEGDEETVESLKEEENNLVWVLTKLLD